MMKELSKLLAGIPPSMTLAVNDKAKALQAAGHDVIALAGGDPDFATPANISAAAWDAIVNKGATNYPAPTKGIVPALEAIADKMARENGITVNARTDIVITPGGKWALNLALAALLNPGDEVLYLEPVWVSYPPMISIAGGVPVAVSLPSEDNFRITEALLEEKISPRSKALMVNSPNNPTGRVLTSAEVAAICAVAIRHDLYVLADELYEKLIFDGRHPHLAGRPARHGRAHADGQRAFQSVRHDRLAPGLAGGTDADHEAGGADAQPDGDLSGPFHDVRRRGGTQRPPGHHRRDARFLSARRDFMVDALNELPGIECRSIEGAFYLFPKFTHSTRNTIALAEALLDKAGVAGTPGEAFGASGKGHLRFSIATAFSDLERAVERIAKVVAEL